MSRKRKTEAPGKAAVPRTRPLQTDPPACPSAPVSGAGADGRREALIASAAYFRAEKRHFAPGHELDDWLAAERDVERSLAGPAGASA